MIDHPRHKYPRAGQGKARVTPNSPTPRKSDPPRCPPTLPSRPPFPSSPGFPWPPSSTYHEVHIFPHLHTENRIKKRRFSPRKQFLPAPPHPGRPPAAMPCVRVPFHPPRFAPRGVHSGKLRGRAFACFLGQCTRGKTATSGYSCGQMSDSARPRLAFPGIAAVTPPDHAPCLLCPNGSPDQ